jgi:hypothetical protein
MIVELRVCDVRYSTPRLDAGPAPGKISRSNVHFCGCSATFGAGPSNAGEPFVALVFPIAPGAVRQEIYFGQIFYVFVT